MSLPHRPSVSRAFPLLYPSSVTNADVPESTLSLPHPPLSYPSRVANADAPETALSLPHGPQEFLLPVPLSHPSRVPNVDPPEVRFESSSSSQRISRAFFDVSFDIS